MTKTGIIYETTNLVNGHLYRGQHYCHQRCGGLDGECEYLGSGRAMKRAIKKYGEGNFERRTLIVCATEHLDLYEKILVDEDFVERQDTYNLQIGGKTPTPTAEIRAKISAAITGRKLSPEHRAKIGAAHKGKTNSPEHRAKISASHKGKKLSPEHRAKLSAARKGKKFTAEHRANLSKSLKAYAEQTVGENK